MRALSSSSESLRDWIWPESWSILAVAASICCAELLLQAADGDGHLVDGVGGLLDEVLEDAHALVVGLLEARDGVLELLNWVWSWTMSLLTRVGGEREGGGDDESDEEGEGGGGWSLVAPVTVANSRFPAGMTDSKATTEARGCCCSGLGQIEITA